MFYLLLNFAIWNVRRLKLDIKIKIVYTIVPLNLIIVLFYMLPNGLNGYIDPILKGYLGLFDFWYIISHAAFGFITMFLAISLLLIFFPNIFKHNQIPLVKIRKFRPIMILTYIFWTLTLINAIIIYIHFYLGGFPFL